MPMKPICETPCVVENHVVTILVSRLPGRKQFFHIEHGQERDPRIKLCCKNLQGILRFKRSLILIMPYLSAKFIIIKRNESVFDSFGAIFVMDVYGVHRSPWSLSRVTGKNLDPGKHWYVLTSSLCGVKPNVFAKNEIFRRFPEEIRSVAPADLKPAKRGCSFNMQPTKLLVVSSFSLCAALLRQRDLSPDGFVGSAKFIPVVDAVNGIALDEFESLCSLGGKSFHSNHGSHELQELQSRIAELESELQELEKKSECVNSFLSLSPDWQHLPRLIVQMGAVTAAAAAAV